MRIKVKNLGPIKQAEFDIGQLTTISGANNTGKTYATYAIYGFLDYFQNAYEYPFSNTNYKKLLADGKVVVDLKAIHSKRSTYINSAAQKFSKVLHQVFGREKPFSDTEFFVSHVEENLGLKAQKLESNIGTHERPIIRIEKKKGSTDLVVSLLLDSDDEDSAPLDFARRFISEAIKEVVFEPIIPAAFICSAERTGAAIFYKELNFTRNRLVDLLGDKSNRIQPFDLFKPFQGSYPVPVRRNVDFIRELSEIKDKESFLLKEQPQLLDDFSDIIGGVFAVNKDDDVQYLPNSSKGKTKLSLIESSSSVRSLLDLGFYLRHVVKKGDLLFVDEPELNLHPGNQRRIARLFAQLVNLGVKVFITTHSDYIIKELNTLLMLNGTGEHLQEIGERHGYSRQELLKSSQVKSFTAKLARMTLDDRVRSTVCLTLVSNEIDQKIGIRVESFDTTIDEMNQIQEEILWSGDDA